MRKSTITSLFNKHWLFISSTAFIFILAFFLRAQESISGNYLFLIDQGRDMMAVKQIVFDHHLTLIGPYTSLQGIFQGPLWYYLLSIPVFLASGNPISAIYLMLIISMSVALTSFFWMKKRFGKSQALLVAFLFAVSPEAIAAATYSWNPHPMWLLILLFTISLYELKRNKKFIIFLLIIVSLMFHFETALGAFFLIASFIYIIVFERSILKSKVFYIGILSAALLFTPQVFFDLRHDFLMTKSVLTLFQGSKQGLLVKGESSNYVNLVIGHFYAFMGNFRSGFVSQGILSFVPNLLLIMLIPVITLFKRKEIVHKNEKTLFIILSRFILIILALSFLYPFPIRYWFLTGFQTFYLLIFGIVFSIFLRIRGGKLLIIFLVLCFTLYSFSRLYITYLKPPDDGGIAKVKGKIDAIDYIYKEAGRDKFNLLVFTPPVNTDAYDYLIFWRAKNIYGYVPGHEKKRKFYLLIEPDPEKPWSYNGWLETVIKSGKVTKTVNLPSGFIVQERVEENE